MKKNRMTHILLVEDESAHAALIQRAFQPFSNQYHLTVASSVQAARASIEASLPDIVLADLLLPDGRGVDLLPFSSEKRRFPLVVMTSHGNEQVAVEAMKAGALDYIVKSEAVFADMPHIVERALREWDHIMERKRAEEQLRASLREKELLVQEVYHRTRNNMQVIHALLELQSAKIKDEETLQTFQALQSRIHSMSFIHEKLYRSDLTTVNLKEYVEELSRILLVRYQRNSGTISLRFDTEPVLISIDPAIPCGLIFNELLTNCFKHAFPQKSDGEIIIRLHQADEGTIECRVSDNGVGLPKSFALEKAETLGFQLIKILAEQQLQGAIIHERYGRGTGFIARFKPPHYKKRI